MLVRKAPAPICTRDRSAVVSTVELALRPARAPPAVNATLSFAKMSLSDLRMNAPGEPALPTRDSRALSPISTRVVSAMLDWLSAPPPAMAPPDLPRMLGVSRKSLKVWFTASMSMSFAVTIAASPMAAVTSASTQLSVEAPSPAKRPPVRACVRALKADVCSALMSSSPTPAPLRSMLRVSAPVRFLIRASVVLVLCVSALAEAPATSPALPATTSAKLSSVPVAVMTRRRPVSFTLRPRYASVVVSDEALA